MRITAAAFLMLLELAETRAFDTRESEMLRIFISHCTPQHPRTPVFVLDMNGAAGSSKSQASRAGQPKWIQ